MNLARLLGFLFTYGVVGPRPSAGTVDVIAGIVDLEKETIGYSKKWDSAAPFRISLTFPPRKKGVYYIEVVQKLVRGKRKKGV